MLQMIVRVAARASIESTLGAINQMDDMPSNGWPVVRFFSASWEVGDRSTGAFSNRFYEDYRKGNSGAESMRLAALALIRNKAGGFHEPITGQPLFFTVIFDDSTANPALPPKQHFGGDQPTLGNRSPPTSAVSIPIDTDGS